MEKEFIFFHNDIHSLIYTHRAQNAVTCIAFTKDV